MNMVLQSVETALMPVTNFIGQQLYLTQFPPHAGVFYISFAGFTVVHILSSILSKQFFPIVYANLSKRNKWNWNVHAVSMAHALVVCPWALYLAMSTMPAVDNHKAFGWDARLGNLQAVACAYFLWDTFETIISGAGIDFVLHGAVTLFIFASGYRPWVAYYGPRALLWELSTPLLNIHWFIDKSGKTGSTFQLINGILLLVVFFCARLVYGAMISIDFLKTMYGARHDASPVIILTFALGNITLNILNWIWYGKMIAAIRKRFTGTSKKDADATPKKVVLDGEELLLPKRENITLATNGAFVTRNKISRS